MAREIGVVGFPANFEGKKAAPLDARQKCNLLSDMFSVPYQYKGMIVAVTDESNSSDNGVYLCINPAPPQGSSTITDWQ